MCKRSFAWFLLLGVLFFGISLCPRAKEKPTKKPHFLVKLPKAFPDAHKGAGYDLICLEDHLFFSKNRSVRNQIFYVRTEAGAEYLRSGGIKGIWNIIGRTQLRDGSVHDLPEEGKYSIEGKKTFSFAKLQADVIVQIQYTRHLSEASPKPFEFGFPFPTETAGVHVFGDEGHRLFFSPMKRWSKDEQSPPGLSSIYGSIPPIGTLTEPETYKVFAGYYHDYSGPIDPRTWHDLGKKNYPRHAGDSQMQRLLDPIPRGLPLKERFQRVAQALDHAPFSVTSKSAVIAFSMKGLTAHRAAFQSKGSVEAPDFLPSLDWFSAWGVSVEVGENEHWYYLPAYSGYPGGALPEIFNGGRAWVLTKPKDFLWRNLPTGLDPGVRERFALDLRNADPESPVALLDWTIEGPNIRNFLRNAAIETLELEERTGRLNDTSLPSDHEDVSAAALEWIETHCENREAMLQNPEVSVDLEKGKISVQSEISLPAFDRGPDGKYLLQPFALSWAPYHLAFPSTSKGRKVILPGKYYYQEEVILPADHSVRNWDLKLQGPGLALNQRADIEEEKVTLLRELNFSKTSFSPKETAINVEIMTRLRAEDQSVVSVSRDPEKQYLEPKKTEEEAMEKADGVELVVTYAPGRFTFARETLVRYRNTRYFTSKADSHVKKWRYEQGKSLLSTSERMKASQFIDPKSKSPDDVPTAGAIILDYRFPAPKTEDMVVQQAIALSQIQQAGEKVLFTFFAPEDEEDIHDEEKWKRFRGFNLESTVSGQSDPYKSTKIKIPFSFQLDVDLPYAVTVELLSTDPLSIPFIPLMSKAFNLSKLTVQVDQREKDWRLYVHDSEGLPGYQGFSRQDGIDSFTLDLHSALEEEAEIPRLEIFPAQFEWKDKTYDFGSWKELAKSYVALMMRDSESESETIKELPAPVEGDSLADLYRQVRDQISYIAIELGTRGFLPYAAETTQTNGWGDCKDMATLLIRRAQNSGLELYPALVHAGSGPPIDRDFPSLHWFNHVVTVYQDDQGWQVLDPTAKHFEPGELRADLYGRTFFVLKDEPEFFTYREADPTDSSLDIEIFVVPGEGEMEVRVEESLSGPLRHIYEQSWRSLLSFNLEDTLIGYGQMSAGAVSKAQAGSIYLDGETLKVQYQFVVPATLNQPGEMCQLKIPGIWGHLQNIPDLPPHMGKVHWNVPEGWSIFSEGDPVPDFSFSWSLKNLDEDEKNENPDSEGKDTTMKEMPTFLMVHP